MTDQACPLPGGHNVDDTSAMKRMLAGRRIAIVGLSDDPSRPSNGVAAYLIAAGKEVIPVNPNCETILEQNCYASLDEIPGEVDVVNVFRRPEHCADVVRTAIAIGAKGVWLQSGIVSPEAAGLARAAGIDFVQNHCIKVEHMVGR